jgi:hypothetical protein
MRPIAIGATILIIAASTTLFGLQRENRRHEQQLADYEQHVQEQMPNIPSRPHRLYV